MRKAFKLAALAPFMAVLMLVTNTTSAGAAISGGGTVLGTVNITLPARGITLTSLNTRYLFRGVRIDGAFVSAPGGAICLGGFTVANVFGLAVGENLEGGSGNVSLRTNQATFTNGRGCTGLFYGVFQRIGPNVVVVLTVKANVYPSAFTIVVEAEFVPPPLQAAARAIRTARFNGVFSGEGAA